MKKVIDGETMKCLEYFDPKDVDTVLEKYKKLGEWEDVDTDNDGDIILWKNI